MKDRIQPQPRFEFEGGPTAIAAVVLTITMCVLFVMVSQPIVVFAAPIGAGIAASITSGYNENSGNNAFLGVVLANLCIGFVLVFAGTLLTGSPIIDAAFIGGVTVMVWLLGVGMVLGLIAYISAVCTDYLRDTPVTGDLREF